MAINTNLYVYIQEDGNLGTGGRPPEYGDTGFIVPRPLRTRFGGIWNFNEKTTEEVAVLGFYLAVNFDDQFNRETHNLIGPDFDHDLKTATYTLVEKTPTEILQYQTNQQNEHIELLWNMAHDYEYSRISGSALSMLTALVLNGNAKGLAVQTWIESIWDKYYLQKSYVQADWTHAPDLNYATCGEMPHTVPELIVEYKALATP